MIGSIFSLLSSVVTKNAVTAEQAASICDVVKENLTKEENRKPLILEKITRVFRETVKYAELWPALCRAPKGKLDSLNISIMR